MIAPLVLAVLTIARIALWKTANLNRPAEGPAPLTIIENLVKPLPAYQQGPYGAIPHTFVTSWLLKG